MDGMRDGGNLHRRSGRAAIPASCAVASLEISEMFRSWRQSVIEMSILMTTPWPTWRFDRGRSCRPACCHWR
eukprot:403883-Hanusia_phi.AAC.1